MVDAWGDPDERVRRIWPRSFEPNAWPSEQTLPDEPASAGPEVVDTVRGWLDHDDAGELLGDFVGRQVEAVLDSGEFEDVDVRRLCDRPDHLFCELLGDVASKVHQVAALPATGGPVGDAAYPRTIDQEPVSRAVKRAAVDLVVPKVVELIGVDALDVVATVLDVAAAGCCPHLDDHRGLDASSSALLTREFVTAVVPRALDRIIDEDGDGDTGRGDTGRQAVG